MYNLKKIFTFLLSLVVTLIVSDNICSFFSKFTTSVHLTIILSSVPRKYE